MQGEALRTIFFFIEKFKRPQNAAVESWNHEQRGRTGDQFCMKFSSGINRKHGFMKGMAGRKKNSPGDEGSIVMGFGAALVHLKVGGRGVVKRKGRRLHL